MITRIFQYVQRFSAVYLNALPGAYNRRKLELLKEFYEKTNSFLKDLGVEYWLSYGTLLGWYREGGIIAHDIDIDYAASSDMYERILKDEDKLPVGLKLFDTSENHKGPKLYFSYKGFDADIYFYEKREGMMYPTLISSIPSDMIEFPEEWIYPLREVSFLNNQTYVPSNTKAYLEHCYGYIGKNAAFDKKTGYYYPKE